MTEHDGQIRAHELRFALGGWRSPNGTVVSESVLHEAAQGIVYALLRHADPAAATILHDSGDRKALSVAPLRVGPLTGGLARATLRIATWSGPLTDLVATAVALAGEARVALGGVPALLLDAVPLGSWSVADFLAATPAHTIRVRFATPTYFGFGRHPDGVPRPHLLPDPGLVVASWLRAWHLTGDTTLDWLPTRPEDLGQMIALADLPVCAR